MADTTAHEIGRSALLLLDLHQSTIERFEAHNPDLVANTQRCLEVARAARIPVVYVAARFRPGFPEISPRNEQLSALLASGHLAMAQQGREIHPAVAPADGDIVVEKKRVGAFVGSDLDLVLRAQGVERLVVGGIATSGVVLSTVRAAADLDYRIVVLSDCCADPDPLVNQVLLERVLPTSGRVVTSGEWCTSVAPGSPVPSE